MTTTQESPVIPMTTTTPERPAILPSLAAAELLVSLQYERRRLVFMAEHLEHPRVSEGVADAIMDAMDSITYAVQLQKALMLGADS